MELTFGDFLLFFQFVIICIFFFHKILNNVDFEVNLSELNTNCKVSRKLSAYQVGSPLHFHQRGQPTDEKHKIKSREGGKRATNLGIFFFWVNSTDVPGAAAERILKRTKLVLDAKGREKSCDKCLTRWQDVEYSLFEFGKKIFKQLKQRHLPLRPFWRSSLSESDSENCAKKSLASGIKMKMLKC